MVRHSFETPGYCVGESVQTPPGKIPSLLGEKETGRARASNGFARSGVEGHAAHKRIEMILSAGQAQPFINPVRGPGRRVEDGRGKAEESPRTQGCGSAGRGGVTPAEVVIGHWSLAGTRGDLRSARGRGRETRARALSGAGSGDPPSAGGDLRAARGRGRETRAQRVVGGGVGRPAPARGETCGQLGGRVGRPAPSAVVGVRSGDPRPAQLSGAGSGDPRPARWWTAPIELAVAELHAGVRRSVPGDSPPPAMAKRAHTQGGPKEVTCDTALVALDLRMSPT